MEKLSLRQVRALKGLSQEEFAKAIGMTPSALMRRENGQTQWTLEEVRTVCVVFDIDPGLLSLCP